MKPKGPILAVIVETADPLGFGRVQLNLVGAEEGPPLWAPVLVPQASAGSGVWFRPEIGDEVVVDFLNGDLRRPIILGALWNERQPPPRAGAEEHVIRTRSGHAISLDDDHSQRKVTITSGDGRQILLDDSIGQGQIEIRNGSETLRIVINDESSTIRIEAAAGDIVLDAGGDLTLKATNINLEAAAQVDISGTAGVDIESNATVQVRGALAQVNGGLILLDGSQVVVNGRPI